MTCVVGYRHGSRVWMGHDSASISGWDRTDIRGDTKMYRNGDYLIGFTSSYRMGQLLGLVLQPPKWAPGFETLFNHMVTKFIPAARHCLKENGYITVDKNSEEAGQYLVACYGHLFKIDPDQQVVHIPNFAAVGCGAAYALGALATSDTVAGGGPLTPASIPTALQWAMQTAGRFSVGVYGPYHVEEL